MATSTASGGPRKRSQRPRPDGASRVVAASRPATISSALIRRRLTQAGRHLAGQLGERLGEAQPGRPRVGERHREAVQHPAGLGRHDHHPAGQEHRLRDRVGDEQGGEPLGQVEPEELVVEALAGDLVQGPERLVEQEQLRLQGEGAGQRHPHAHPARQGPGMVAGEVVQPDQGQGVAGAAAALVPGQVAQLGEQLHVGLDGAPGQQSGVLEDVTDLVGGDLGGPPLAAVSPAATRSRVLLPQPDGPRMLTNSPGATLRSTPSRATVPSGTACRPH